MLLIKEINKKILFWIFQSFAWITYWLFNLTLFHDDHIYDHTLKIVFWTFLIYLFGFGITLLHRKFYQIIFQRSYSFFKITFIILIISFISANIWLAYDQMLDMIFESSATPATPWSFVFFIQTVFWWTLVLLAWGIMYFFVKFKLEWHLEKNKTKQAELLTKIAQMQLLRYKLNPHFLFNSLNSIRALISEDKKAAKEVITQLSEFLRYSLVNKANSIVFLKDELDAVQHYFEIEKKRFENKINLHLDIDPAAQDFPIMNFLILPLFEKMVKYAIENGSKEINVQIKARRFNDELVLEVFHMNTHFHRIKNNLKKVNISTELKDLRQRLDDHMANNYSFTIGDTIDGKKVTLVLKEKFTSKKQI